MESLANAMDKLIRRVLVQSGKCPECSEPLYSWRAKNKDGSERCKPTCMSCGYKALRVKEDIQTERIYNDSLKERLCKLLCSCCELCKSRSVTRQIKKAGSLRLM